VLGYLAMLNRKVDATGHAIKSIAVLPFQDLSGDPGQNDLADGMTEALIGSLAKIHALKVVRGTSVLSYNGNKNQLPDTARELSVDGVIEGSLQSRNGRMKVRIQLIHALTGTRIWAEDYERALTDAFMVQDEMARAIADEIRIQVSPEDRARLASAASVNPAARKEYELGRFYFWKFIAEDHQRAIGHFKRAIQIDRGFAAAWAGLSLALQQWGYQVSAPRKDFEPQAREAALKALELDERLAEAHVAQGHLRLFYEWDWSGAENALIRALELDPNNLTAHHLYALLLMALERHAKALEQIRIAADLAPLSAHVQSTLGKILLHAGNPEGAIVHLAQAKDLEPRNAATHGRLGAAYEEMGRYADALAIYDKARQLRGNPPDYKTFRAIQAIVYARMGKRREAERLLAGLGDDGPAGAYAALGNKNEAFRLLFQRVGKRSPHLYSIRSDPQFSSLHSDPRWPQLLRLMNFELN
jgi:TolB-like protein/Flp pilus assembly protein TadD